VHVIKKNNTDSTPLLYTIFIYNSEQRAQLRSPDTAYLLQPRVWLCPTRTQEKRKNNSTQYVLCTLTHSLQVLPSSVRENLLTTARCTPRVYLLGSVIPIVGLFSDCPFVYPMYSRVILHLQVLCTVYLYCIHKYIHVLARKW
jgi:hypothetical protein